MDLVFFNYVLKCFVLIDLKKGKLSHQDIGQMDMYVRMFDDLERQVTERKRQVQALLQTVLAEAFDGKGST